MPDPRPSTTPRRGAVRTLAVGVVLLAAVVLVRLAIGLPAALAVGGLVAVLVGFVALVGGASAGGAVRSRRGAVAVLAVGGAGAFLGGTAFAAPGPAPTAAPTASTAPAVAPTADPLAEALAALPVRAAASSDGFDAARRFGRGWTDADGDGCDTRADVLRRDLVRVRLEGCRVVRGVLHDPWAGGTVRYARGHGAVRVARALSLEDAWRTGAQDLPKARRVALANDPRGLAAVATTTAASRGTGDAAAWLPDGVAGRCAVATAQIALKRDYGLWVTPAERAALTSAIAGCADQDLPVTPAPAATPAPTPSATASAAGTVRGGAACTGAGAEARNRSGDAVVCRTGDGDGDDAGLRWRRPA